MIREKLSYYIACKINSTKEFGQVSLSVKIATVSVAVSLMVMIISSSVVVGFRSEISSRLFDFSADFQIVEATNYAYVNNKTISKHNDFIQQISSLNYIENPSVFAIKTALIKSKTNMKGIVLKGVGEDYDWSRLDAYLIEGKSLDTKGLVRDKEVFISKKIAKELELSVGDKVEMVYFTKPQRNDLFYVGGIYSSNISELDDSYILCDIRDIQRVNGWGDDMITGYDIYLKDEDNYQSAKQMITETLYLSGPSTYRTEALADTRIRFENILGWLDLQKINELVLLIIMIIVSIFNVVSMVLIILLQKTSMIGVLKSIGMRDRHIQLIFVFRGLKTVLKGVVIGNILGIGLCLIQQEFKLIKLDEVGYMVDSVPIDFDLYRIFIINIIIIGVLFFFQWITTFVIASMEPYKAIKYEKK